MCTNYSKFSLGALTQLYAPGITFTYILSGLSFMGLFPLKFGDGFLSGGGDSINSESSLIIFFKRESLMNQARYLHSIVLSELEN